jgi:hypothetical protein
MKQKRQEGKISGVQSQHFKLQPTTSKTTTATTTATATATTTATTTEILCMHTSHTKFADVVGGVAAVLSRK